MVASFVSVVSQTVGAGTAANAVAPPSGSGGVLVAICTGNSGTTQTVSAPDGNWTARTTDTSASFNISTFSRTAPGSEPANYTFTRTGTLGNFTVTIARISGADTSNPVAASGLAAATGTGSIVLPSVAAAATGTLLLQAVNATGTGATTWTAPGTATVRWNTTSSGAAVPVIGADETVGSGATGTRTYERTAPGPIKGAVFAINPDPPKSGSASLGWSAALTAAGSATHRGSAALAWSATIGDATGETDREGTATAAWTAGITAAGETDRSGAGALAWSADLDAEGESAHQGAASAAWSASITAHGESVHSGSASLSWTVGVVAVGGGAAAGSAELEWTADVDAAGETERRGVVTYAWTGQITAEGTAPRSGTALLAWSVDLDAAGAAPNRGEASLAWSAGIEASGPPQQITVSGRVKPSGWRGSVRGSAWSGRVKG